MLRVSRIARRRILGVVVAMLMFFLMFRVANKGAAGVAQMLIGLALLLPIVLFVQIVGPKLDRWVKGDSPENSDETSL